MRRVPYASAVRSIGALALILCSVTAALAYRQGRPDGRFDDFARSREGGVIAVAPLALNRLPAADSLRLGWEGFQSRHGGRWSIYVDERTGMPTLVSGSGVEGFAPGAPGGTTVEDLDAGVRTFLQDHRGLLGDWTAVLQLDPDASSEIRPGYWQLVYRQTVDGVTVENARFEFHVSQGRLVMFGATHWAMPGVSGDPTLTAAEARAALDAYLGTSTGDFEPAGDPELALVAIDAAPGLDGPAVWKGARGVGLTHALVWRIAFREETAPALWIGEVDAHDGSIRAFYDGAHYTSIRGGVFPIAPTGDCANGGCEIDGFPLPYTDWTEDGQPESFTDTFGNLSCGISEAGFQTNLIGQYVEVADQCGVVSESGNCDTGLELSTKAGENCDVQPGASPGNTAAARSGYYQINRVAEIARYYNPGNAWLEGRVTYRSNVNNTCNAVWDGRVNMYRAGNGCANTGEIQGVVVHEWGHGYDENDGGGYDNTSEAYADVVALFSARESCMGGGFFVDGSTCSGYGDTCLTCTGVRDMDWAARQFNNPATPQNFVQNQCPSGGGGPCGYETHCEAYPIGEAIYDLATRDLPAAGMDLDTAWQLAERLWYETRDGSGGAIYTCALPDSDSCAASSWYQKMRTADDDDGNLANGTPHAAELYAAFARHNIACGAAEDPENQSTSGCPVLATPVLSITEIAAGTELSWNAVTDAAEYLVYRGELGCSRQQVVIASVPAGQTTYVDDVSDPGLPRYYRIEAVGANAACRSAVSNCEASPLGARLQRNAYRIVEEGANVNLNGFFDPGETVKLPVTLFNSGLEDAFGVSGRLRVVDPAQGRALTRDASWGDISTGSELESSDPHFEVTLFEEVACGDALALELDMGAANAATRTNRFAIPLGNPNRDYLNDTQQSIPRETEEPVISTIVMDEDRTITELDVTLNIRHFDETDLIVELQSPQGTVVRLHDRSNVGFGIRTRYDRDRNPDGPGTMADFNGESTQGTWTLSIEDVVLGQFGFGTLEDWTLHFTVAEPFDCDPKACPEPAPSEAVSGLLVDKTVDGGTGRIDLDFSWSVSAGVAGYHLLQSPVATFGSEVELTERTDGATAVTVIDGAAITPPLTFFQVRGVNGCNQESP